MTKVVAITFCAIVCSPTRGFTCDSKAGTCNAEDDDKTSLIQVKHGISKATERSKQQTPALPGSSTVVPCLAREWQEDFTTGLLCYDPHFLSHRAEGHEKHGTPLWLQGPEPDGTLCLDEKFRFQKECPADQPEAKNPEFVQLPAYTSKCLRAKYARKDELQAWNPDDLEAPFPVTFDELVKLNPEGAQAWESKYLDGLLPAGMEPDVGAHWFEVILNGNPTYPIPDLSEVPGLGRLYSTRVPRHIGEFTGFENPTYALPQKSFDAKGSESVLYSDALSFKANKERKQVDVVVPLVISEDLKNTALWERGGQEISGLMGHDELEPKGADSKGLFDYYEALGLTILRCPMNDFNTPNKDQFVECVERIAVFLAQGKNVVVHCFGGSGRTGTVVLGVAKALGVSDVIAHGRRAPGKAQYLDVHEQELFVDQMPKVHTDWMKQEIPAEMQKTIWGAGGRFERNLQAAETAGRQIAQCEYPDNGGLSGEKVPMQKKCELFGRCRGCMSKGEGNPGQYPPVLQKHVHRPMGDERYPAVLQFQGVLWYNYWMNQAPYFKPQCIGDTNLCEG